jgi:tRNA (guanine10-N2)-methyltransferase
VTIKKVTAEQYPAPTFDPISLQNENIHIPAHKDFREKYFQGFKSATSEPS